MKKAHNSVKTLIKKYNTSDPVLICEKMGITLLEQELPACVNGFTVTMYDMPFIVLNGGLGYYEKRFTTAHELGHIVMHSGTNSLNLSCNTGFCVSKYERQADSFAAWLLMYEGLSELEGHESVTAEEISRIAHIPLSVANNTFNE